MIVYVINAQNHVVYVIKLKGYVIRSVARRICNVIRAKFHVSKFLIYKQNFQILKHRVI